MKSPHSLSFLMFKPSKIIRGLSAWFILLNIFLFDAVTFAQIPSPSAWDHVATHDEGFFSPVDFRILEGEKTKPSRLLVLDSRASDQALARLRLEDGSPIGRTVQAGPGPGRVSGQGMGISLFSDGSVLLWDGGNRRANVYSADLRFQHQVEGLQDLSVSSAALVNDSTLAVSVSVSASNLFRLYRLRQNSESVRVTEKPITTIETTDHKLLSQGQLDRNPMIRQGVARRVGDQLCFGYMFGSVVIGITETGLQWVTSEPVNHALPTYDFQDRTTTGERTRTTYTAPDRSKFAQGILDLAGDASHLYVLYSGQKVEQTMGDMAVGVEAIRHSDRLFVFDRATGTFVKKMRLPIRAKSIEVTSQYAVLFATEERDAPTFEVYRFPETGGTP